MQTHKNTLFKLKGNDILKLTQGGNSMEKNILLKSVKISNGETLGYRESGSGDKVLVLVHGNMSSSKHYDVLIEALNDSYKIYAIDLRGFGTSTYNTPINSIKDFAEDLKLFVDALDLKDFYLAGWSTGGTVSMEFVINNPGYAKKLILIESVGIKGYLICETGEKGTQIPTKPYQDKESLGKDAFSIVPILNANKNRDKDFYRALWDAVIYTENKPSEEKYDEYLEDMLTQVNTLDVYWALHNFNISHEYNGLTKGTGEVDKLTLPTLVLQGERDYITPPINGEEIKQGIGDNALLVKLPSGHSPFIDCIDLLVKNIIDFIEK